jgi:hypothetical protein
MSKQTAKFCDGCPLGNGVSEISETFLSDFSYDSDIGGFNTILVDASDENIQSKAVHANVNGDIDSTMSSGTFRHIVDAVRQCHSPSEATVKRLGGLLGSKTIESCGAFPDQNPRKIHVTAQDTGWFDPADFLD